MDKLKPKTVVELLTHSRNLIAEPENWCKKSLAIDMFGNDNANPCDPFAVQWCAVGAMEAILPMDDGIEVEDITIEASNLLRLEAFRRGYRGIVQYNNDDSTTHDDIISLFDTAIAEAERKQI